jgi:hypothetical protein
MKHNHIRAICARKKFNNPNNTDEAKPWQKSGNTDRWTEILFRALSNRVAKRWRFVSFRGVGGGEWCGIVDVMAIRKNTAPSKDHLLKPGDLFDIVLVQMKGGLAKRPSLPEIKRLKAVKKFYQAKDIILFEWKRGQGCIFSRREGDKWTKSSTKEIFG